MSHVRTQIRAAVVGLLTGLATTGSRVFQSRMRPQTGDALPCLLISTADEDIAPTTSLGGALDRTLQLVVRGFAAGATCDSTLDQIAFEVETVLLPEGYVLRRIETDFDDELDKPVGEIRLTFETLYFTPAGSPGVSA